MHYPEASPAQVARFREEGFLVVDGAIDPADLSRVAALCDPISKDPVAFRARDWAWSEGGLAERDFRIVQSFPTSHFPEISGMPLRAWAQRFASSLLGIPVTFWYDQYLAKPPGKGAETPWHQDEAYWGRKLADRGITCWMPFHDVGPENGCMHFIRGGHRDGVSPHRQPSGIKSDLLTCDVDPKRVVACPIRAGGVTFHHSRTPHMATANRTGQWRKILTQHFKPETVDGEGDHYPWKVWVDQAPDAGG